MKLPLSSVAALLLAGTIYLSPAPLRGQTAEDTKIILEMGQKIAAVQKQIIASSNPDEQLALKNSMTEIMEQTLPKLSPRARPPMLIGMKIVQPLQKAGSEYMQMLATYAASPLSDMTAIKTREDIQARYAEIDRLASANQDLIDRYSRFLGDAEKMLDAEKLGADEKRYFLSGLTEKFEKQMGPSKAIRNLDTKMFAQLKSALAHLDQHWGKWQATTGQPITWTDEALEIQFAALVQEINVLADRQANAQQVLSNRL